MGSWYFLILYVDNMARYFGSITFTCRFVSNLWVFKCIFFGKLGMYGFMNLGLDCFLNLGRDLIWFPNHLTHFVNLDIFF